MAITYHFDLYPRDDPRDGTRLVRFTQLQSAEYRGEANGTGAGRISLRGSSVDAAYIDPAGLQYVRVVRDDGSTEVVVGGFFLDNGDYAALTSTGNELLTFGGAGTLAYLERAVMAPHTYISPIFTGQDPFDDTWRLYAQSTVYANGNYLGAMLWRVIYEAQHFTPGSHRHADGVTVTDTHDDDRLENALPALTMGFDAFDDSDAAAWTVTSGEFKAMVGENVISVVKRLMEAGLYVSMDPDTFELNAWEAATHGRTRTGTSWGSSVVRFQAPIGGDIDTGNIKSDAKRGIQAYVKRSAIWAGGQDVFGFSTTGGSDIPWEGFYPSDVVDVDALEYVATTQLGARSDAGDTVRLRMKLGADPTNGRYLPFEHVQLDDRVTLHTGSGQWDWDEQTFPVAALTVLLRQGGDWDALVDLGSSYSSIAERRFQVQTVPTHTHPGICFCTTTVGGSESYDEEDFLTWDSGDEFWSVQYGGGSTPILTPSGTYGGVSGSNGGNFGSVGADTAGRVVNPGSTLRISGHSAGYGQSDPCTPVGVVNFSWGIKFFDSSDVLISTHTVGSHTTAQDAGYVGPDTLDVVVPDDAAYLVLAQHTDGTLGCQPNATHIDSVSVGTVTVSDAVQGTDEFTGSSTCAARCDHKHHGSDVILDNGDTVQEYVDSDFLGHGHDAEDVAITDTGGYFDGTTVEAALQELGASGGGGSDLGWYVVTDPAYGAVGDGSNDDTAEIQAAIDAAPDHATVYFPPGTYKISAVLTIDHPLRLRGGGSLFGASTINQVTANTTAIDFTYAWDTDSGDHEDAGEVMDLKVNGPTGGSSGRGIDCTASIHVIRTEVEGFFDGIYVGPNAYWTWIQDSLASRAARAAVLLAGSHNTTLDNVRMWKSTYGLFAESTIGDQEGLRILNCNVEQNTNAGLLIDGARAVLISGCYFESRANDAPDISLGLNYATTDVVIQSCWFTDYTPGPVSLWHIDADDVDRLTIIGCRMPGSGAGGGDIRGTANTDNVAILNTSYVTTSGLPTANFDLDPSNPPWDTTAQHYEVLMSGASPAEPLEDGSGTDWLYVLVS